MNYQAIRAAIENPLLTAFSSLVPAVPVFFDNITAAPANSTTEHVKVNVTFGVTNETMLVGSMDNARGAIVIRVYSEKGKGPARNQALLTTAVAVLETLNNTAKTTTGVYFRVGNISGPTFSANDTSPLFVGQIDAPYTATVLS
jgi:hypothetical protein